MYNDIYGYSYSVPAQNSMSGFGMGILMIYVIAMLVIALISLASYILRGIGLYTIAKRRGMNHPWLAFVPFMRTYLQGTLGGDIKFKNKTMRDTGIWLAVIPFMYGMVFTVLYGVMMLCGIVTVFSMAVHVGVGRILFLTLLILIFVVVSVGYKVLYKTLRVLVNRQIYQNMTSENMAIVHAVIGALVPLYESICIFVLRNREAKAEDATSDGADAAEPEATDAGAGAAEPETADAGAGATENVADSQVVDSVENDVEPQVVDSVENVVEPQVVDSDENDVEPQATDNAENVMESQAANDVVVAEAQDVEEVETATDVDVSSTETPDNEQ